MNYGTKLAPFVKSCFPPLPEHARAMKADQPDAGSYAPPKRVGFHLQVRIPDARHAYKFVRALGAIFSCCVLAYSSVSFSAQDCKFPSRGGAGYDSGSGNNEANIVQAASGGVWQKQNSVTLRTGKGYFRFIYFMQGRLHPQNRLFLEAWQQMEVGHDRFVGCAEIKDGELSKDVELGSIVFRAADTDSIYLDMKLYGPDIKWRPHSIRVPFDFIDTIPD